MTDSSQAQIRIYEESSWGETPSTSNKMTNLNMTGADASGAPSTQRSQSIRSDRNVKSIGRVDNAASANISGELVYGEYDALFEGVLYSDFGTTFSTSGTGIAFVNSTSKITDSGNGFTNVVVGQFIQISGASNAANNGRHKVTVKTSAGDITVASTLVDESAGATVTAKGTMCKNGSTEKSFLIEQQFSSSLFDYLTGMEVSNLSGSFSLEQFITLSIDFVGKISNSATSTQGDGSPTAASILDSINTVDSLEVFVGGVLSTLEATAFNFTINPNLRPKKAMGNLGAVGIGAGTFNITGGMTVHNDSNTLVDAKDDFTTTSLAVYAADAAGNGYVFDFPSVKITSAPRPIPGQDQFTFQNISFESQFDSTLGGMIGITRIPA